MKALHTDVTQVIIKAFYTVYNTLGYGFSEKVYHKAMLIELQRLGIQVVSESPIQVYYKGEIAGDFLCGLGGQSISDR